MTDKNMQRIMQSILIMLLSVLMIMLTLPAVVAQLGPTAPDTMTNISSQSPSVSGGYAMTTAGGTISVVNINATTQNPHWKAYVGNISGRLALQDAGAHAVYDWNITTAKGELYATRKSGLVDWNSITCAGISNIIAEETALKMTGTSEDSIRNTFTNKNHTSFYAGLTSVGANSCNSTNLYVNGAASDDYAEVLLYDSSYMVYAALIEDSVIGFDGSRYDFEIILPDSGLEGSQTPITYYFYVELI